MHHLPVTGALITTVLTPLTLVHPPDVTIDAVGLSINYVTPKRDIFDPPPILLP